MAKSIKRNFIYNLLLNITSVIAPLITAPYVARVLEPDGVGLYNFASTYAGYFALFAMLGLTTYGVREVAKVRDDKEALSILMSQLMSIVAISALIVSLLYISSVFVIDKIYENYIVFLLAGFGVYIAPFKINWFYQGIEDFGFITLRTLIIRVISIICLFAFVREKNDLILYVIFNVLGGVIADIWNFVKMWQSGVKPKLTLQGLRPHFTPMFVLFASTIAISIYTVLDTLMLGFLSEYSQVGYYTNAMHITKVTLTLVASLSIVVVPRVSYYMKDKEYGKINDLLKKSISIVSFLAIPCSIGIFCIAPVFVPLFYGNLFVGAIQPLMILSFIIIAIGLSNITGMQILVGMGHDKPFLYAILVGTFSNFCLNSILIPKYGAVGASIASLIAEFLVLFSTTYFVYKYTPIKISGWSDVMKAVIGAISFVPIMSIMRNSIHGWLFVGVYIMTCALVYMMIEMLLKNNAMILVYGVVVKKMKKHRSF